MTTPDLREHPDAFRARKRAVSVHAEIAREDGVVHTLEGPVSYCAGDAMLSGVEGERWPVPRAHFLASYEPISPTRAGDDGTYRKRPRVVLALRVQQVVDVVLSGGRGTLHARPGDVLVQHEAGDVAVVAKDIFAKTYIVEP